MAESSFNMNIPLDARHQPQPHHSRKPQFPSSRNAFTNRRKKREPDPTTWKRNVNKMLKDCGLNYTGANGRVRCAKLDLVRECKCHRNCFNLLTEKQINVLATEYYSLSYNEQSQYIIGCMSLSPFNNRRRRAPETEDQEDDSEDDKTEDVPVKQKPETDAQEQEQKNQFTTIKPLPQSVPMQAMSTGQNTFISGSQPMYSASQPLTTGQSIQVTNQSLNQPMNQSLNQPTSQSLNQPTNQPFNQPLFTTSVPIHITHIPIHGQMNTVNTLPQNPTPHSIAPIHIQQQQIPGTIVTQQHHPQQQLPNQQQPWPHHHQIIQPHPVAMAANTNTMLYTITPQESIQVPANIIHGSQTIQVPCSQSIVPSSQSIIPGSQSIQVPIPQTVMPIMIHDGTMHHQAYIPHVPPLVSPHVHPPTTINNPSTQPTNQTVNQTGIQSQASDVSSQPPPLIVIKKKKKKRRIRGQNFEYAVKISGVLIHICQKAFRAIFGLTLTRVRTLQIKMREGSNTPKDERGRHKNRPNRIDLSIVERIKHHIRSFPAQESHYPKNKAPVFYLSSDMNVRKMYRLYLDMYEFDQTNPVVKEGLYRSVFNQFNFRFGSKPGTKPLPPVIMN